MAKQPPPPVAVPTQTFGEQLTTKVFNFSIDLTYMVIGGILWLICSLPIFTIGAASVGLHALMLGHRVAKRRQYARPFFAAFGASFKQVTLPWLIMLALMLLFGFNAAYYFASSEHSTMNLVLAVIELALLGVGLVVTTYMTALVAIEVDDALGTRETTRVHTWIVQAAITALGTWYWALAILAVTVAVPAVLWWLGVWQFAIFTVGVIVWLSDWLLVKALRDK